MITTEEERKWIVFAMFCNGIKEALDAEEHYRIDQNMRATCVEVSRMGRGGNWTNVSKLSSEELSDAIGDISLAFITGEASYEEARASWEDAGQIAAMMVAPARQERVG